MKVAVVGATGLVGSVMLKVLEERNFPVTELIPAASDRSVGKKVKFRGGEVSVVSLQQAVEAEPAIALFSAGSAVSLEWAPKFAARGCYVIDNSSAWRMHNDIPLVVPEVNGDVLNPADHIIANPNCSTIQMLVALNPLYRAFGIRHLTVTTYQAVTGSGMKGLSQLMDERENRPHTPFYKRAIDFNCIPQCDDFTDNGYTKEEMKLVNETRKIFNDPTILVNPTAVRVPVTGGHSESVVVTLARPAGEAEVMNALRTAPGMILKEAPEDYPTALDAAGRDEVWVGRVRKGLDSDLTWNLWVVADNLRKGAATNAVQIAECVNQRILNQ